MTEAKEVLLAAQVPMSKSGGVLEGVHLQPRKVAKLAHDAGFRDINVVIAVMVAGSESWLYTRAHNDNVVNGVVDSRDVGLWEINIPASEISTQVEEDLYDPVKNAAAAFDLFSRRGWQPWVGFDSGIYLHPTYFAWGLLGVANMWDEHFQEVISQAGDTTLIRLPFVSIKDLQKLYPGIPLG